MTKTNYETLLARRESAGITQQMEQSADTEKIRVVDPPFVPEAPSGPTRPLLSSGALGVGLACGLVIAYFLAQLFLTFDSLKKKKKHTQQQKKKKKTMIWTNEQRRKRRIELLGFLML